jgi:integrase
MAIYKRGRIYWYKFTFNGEAIRESTRQTNQHTARDMESAHRSSLAKGEVGIRDKKQSLTLAKFCDERFEPWAKSTFEKSSPKTWLDFYRVGLRAARNYKPLASLRLDEITSERVSEFSAYRQSQGLQVSTVNSSLRVLRRILRLAMEWGELASVPNIKRLPGERHRGRVVIPEEEARYLAATSELLGAIATVLVDTGLRPEECYRLRWESIAWSNRRNGNLLVTHGKTAAARRVLPMTRRVRTTLQAHREGARKPLEGWVWPAPTKSGHIEPSSLAGCGKTSLRPIMLSRFGEYVAMGRVLVASAAL